VVKTSPFHGGNPGSSPGGVTNLNTAPSCEGGFFIYIYARVAELADALDLGSSGKPWGFKSLRAHQSKTPIHRVFFALKRTDLVLVFGEDSIICYCI
jgi:hypothetical protein